MQTYKCDFSLVVIMEVARQPASPLAPIPFAEWVERSLHLEHPCPSFWCCFPGTEARSWVGMGLSILGIECYAGSVRILSPRGERFLCSPYPPLGMGTVRRRRDKLKLFTVQWMPGNCPQSLV
jgi:hypothetical protein